METAVWRALAVFRGLGLFYALVIYLLRHDEYAHPVGGWLVLAAMALWSLAVTNAYRSPSGRRWPILALDLALAVAAVVSARFLDDPDRIAAGAQTLPVVWAAAPVLAFAIAGGWVAGVAAAVVVGAADLVHRGTLTAATANNIVLLLLAGAVVGYVVALARRAEASLEQAREVEAEARAVEAATRERERLARDIHDGVLQVLALVGRRGRSAGGEAAELGRLAAEQEQALRSLVTSVPASSRVDGEVDLRALLSTYASGVVTVSTPGTAVPLPRARGEQLAAAVAAALANVSAHAGAGARAWVLLEDEGADLVVSVRDDGVGFAEGRLAEAAGEGRLGVARSICGRVADLGGAVSVTSAPGVGTELEIRVPR